MLAPSALDGGSASLEEEFKIPGAKFLIIGFGASLDRPVDRPEPGAASARVGEQMGGQKSSRARNRLNFVNHVLSSPETTPRYQGHASSSFAANPLFYDCCHAEFFLPAKPAMPLCLVVSHYFACWPKQK